MIDMQTDGYDLDLSSGAMVVSDKNAVVRAVRTIVETFEGTYDWDLEYGIPWPDVLTARRSGVAALLADLVRREIQKVAVPTNVSVTINPVSRSATVVVYVDGSQEPVIATVGV